MKDEISSLDLFHLVKEFKEIEGSKVEKIHQKEKSFLFTFHVRSEGKKLLRIALPGLIYLSEHKDDYPELPGFCNFLRKKLLKTTVREISQKGFERILIIRFEGREMNYIMVVELFGKGNLILCDENYKILGAFENKNWGYRTLRGGVKYEFPPEQANIPELSREKFGKLIDSSDKDSLVKTLAVDLNLGGTYAEEMCALSNINKEQQEASTEEKQRLYENFHRLLDRKIDPSVSSGEVFPFEMELFADYEDHNYETFSQALDHIHAKKLSHKKTASKEKKKEEELARIRKVLEQQELALKNLEKGESQNQKKGEFIYENYEAIKKLLSEFNQIREKHSWEEIKEVLKGHEVIKHINEKEGKIKIDI